MTVMASDPNDPKVKTIHAAAKVLVDAKQVPHSAPGHWAGALYEAGLLKPPAEEMHPAEAAMRERAQTDHGMRIQTHRFIVQHFGGDAIRAAWFFDEYAKEA